MNKQEAIEKIYELKELSYGALGSNWINLGIDKALDIIKQLDEQEKIVPSREEELVGKVKRYEVFQKRTGIKVGIQHEDGSMKTIFTKEELTEYGFDNLDEYKITEVEE